MSSVRHSFIQLTPSGKHVTRSAPSASFQKPALLHLASADEIEWNPSLHSNEQRLSLHSALTESASKASNGAQFDDLSFFSFGAFGIPAQRTLPGLESCPSYFQVPNWVSQDALATDTSLPSLHE